MLTGICGRRTPDLKLGTLSFIYELWMKQTYSKKNYSFIYHIEAGVETNELDIFWHKVLLQPFKSS